MKVSRKTDYALRAMLELAIRAPSKTLARTAEIARRTGSPPKFLEAILSDLRRQGLVESHRGAEGGHRLARAAKLITAGDIWLAMEGSPSLSGRSGRHRPPAEGPARTVQRLWFQVADAALRTAQGVTLEQLAQRALEESNVSDFCI